MSATEPPREPPRAKDFLRAIVEDDRATGRHQQIATRFPPEPNGYLHIGHAKAICVDFGIARDYGGTCNLRYDDTNPTKEDVEYVESIERDVRWLGFAPDRVLYASDYFEEMYRLAEGLVERGLAYVDESTDEEIKALRGSLTEPGRPSAWRDLPPAHHLARLREMRAGALPDGACVLRAKIDLAASNMKMRDPLLYRIRHAHHHRTGDAWCIYPMYDYAHPLSDALEGITHSICTLEFENNRELYDWVIAKTGVMPRAELLGDRPPAPTPPRQYEFARLVLEYTMMSKRKLLKLVEDGVVTGWDDPRMPTLAGMRRRGFTPEAIRNFCDLVGVAKNNSMVDVGKLEYAVRDDLNGRAPRLLGVLRPLPLTLTNVDAASLVTAPLYPEELDPDGTRGTRVVPLDRELVIERDDFAIDPPAGWKRLAPGRVVRLRHAGCVRCDEVVTDAAGEVIGLRGTLLAEPVTDKVAGVIHWVSASRGVTCEVRLYDRLFAVARPDAAEDVTTVLNPRSLEVVAGAVVEPAVVAAAGSPIQLERVGYFVADRVDSRPDALVLNRVITLRDTWAKAEAVEAPTATAEGTFKTKASRAATRPAKKSGAEQRAIARERDAELAARYTAAVDAVGAADADLLHGDRATSDFATAALALAPARAKAIARWLVNEVPRAVGDAELPDTALTPAALVGLVELVETGAITAAVGKELLAELTERGGDPAALVEARGLRQVAGEGDLAPIIASVLAANPAKVAEYRGGRAGLLGFFVGQVMKASGGKANPATVNQLVTAALAAS
jgi:glutaminyl-tRNA synthetase